MLGNFCYFCDTTVDFDDAESGEMDCHASCYKDALEGQSSFARGLYQGIHLYDGFEPTQDWVERWGYPIFFAIAIIGYVLLAIGK